MKGAAKQSRRMCSNHMFLEGKVGSGKAPVRVEQAAISCSEKRSNHLLREDEKRLLLCVQLFAIHSHFSSATLHQCFIILTREEHVSVNALEV